MAQGVRRVAASRRVRMKGLRRVTFEVPRRTGFRCFFGRRKLFGCFDCVVNGGELEDFELAFAVGGDDGGDVADFLAEQRAADGRGGGDEALGDVGLFAGDELVGDLLVLGGVEDHDGGAEADLVAGDVVEVDHGELAHALLELAEAGVDEDLALLGHVVFGVFGEVAEGDGLLDLRGEFGGEFVLESLDLLFESLLDVFHGCVCFAGPVRVRRAGNENFIIRKLRCGNRLGGVGVGEQGGAGGGEEALEEEGGGYLVDDLFAVEAAGAACGSGCVAGEIEEGVGVVGGEALVEQVVREGGVGFLEGLGEGLCFGGLGAGRTVGVEGVAD